MNQDPEDFHHDKQVGAPTTIGAAGKRLLLYPDRRDGPRVARRRRLAIVLILVYFAVPWITIAGNPLFRIDVLKQNAHIFGLYLSISEYNFVFFILAGLGLLLFLVTTLKGRIWCGYACPQTVFVEWIIRPIEEWLEGPALKRRKADQGPWTLERVSRKAAKHLCFAVIAALVANAWLGYFVDPRTIMTWMTSPPTEHPTAFGVVVLIMVLFYFDLGWFREQFCTFLCPYARFQSVLLDNSSPTVYYDSQRGEPRGKTAGSGDCIDCGLCVRVCPTGIDIRNGLQLECIQCERCVDACNSIMTNIKRPQDLIRIDSPAAAAGSKTPWWRRPRVIVYSLFIAVVAAVASYRILSRESLSLTVLRQPGAAYSALPDGRLSNMFNIRAINHTAAELPLRLSLKNPPAGVSFICPQCQTPVPPFGQLLSPFLVVFPPGANIGVVTIANETSGKQHEVAIISPGPKH